MRRLDALPVALLKYYSCQRMSGEEDSQALTPSQVQRAREAIEFLSNLPFRANVRDTGKNYLAIYFLHKFYCNCKQNTFYWRHASCINFTVTANKIPSTGEMLHVYLDMHLQHVFHFLVIVYRRSLPPPSLPSNHEGISYHSV